MLRARSAAAALVLLTMGAWPLLLRAAARGDDDGPDPQATVEELAAAREVARAVEDRVVGALADVRRSSVSVLIMAFPRDKDGNVTGTELQLRGCGSGVLVEHRQKQWVLTNHHVVDGADGLHVITADGETRVMVVQDTVPSYDIALLRFSEKPEGLEAVKVRRKPSEDLQPGSFVVATGNPFFLAMDGASVATLGLVSGKDRVLGGRFLYGTAIQHDAAVNPGNSGGPLWDLDGELVGINGMIISRGEAATGPSNAGASFSIPIYQVERFLEQLADEDRDAAAGSLGVQCSTATDSKGVPEGAAVVSFEAGSPLLDGRNPLERGDVITSLAAQGIIEKVLTADDLTNSLVLHPAGTDVRIKYRRGRRSLTWQGKLARKKE